MLKNRLIYAFLAFVVLFGTVMPVMPAKAAVLSGPENVEIQVPDGYEFYFTPQVVVNDLQNGEYYYGSSNNNIVDFSGILFEENASYLVQISMGIQSTTDQEVYVYYDEQTLTGNEILNLTSWVTPEDAHPVIPDFSDLDFILGERLQYLPKLGTENFKLYEENLFTSSHEFYVKLSGIDSNGNAYFLIKDLSVSPTTDSFSFSNEKEAAAQVQVSDGELEYLPSSISIYNRDFSFHSHIESLDGAAINKLYVTPGIGEQELQFTFSEDLGNGESLKSSWGTTYVNITSDTIFNFTGNPDQLEFTNLSVSDDYIDSYVSVKSGDLHLIDMRQDDGQSSSGVLSSLVEVQDSDGEIILNTTETYWRYNSLDITQPLTSGEYTYIYKLLKNGEKLISASQTFTIKTQDSNDINGLLVHVEDELGNKLQYGNVTLLERTDSSTGNVNNGYNYYDLDYIYMSEVLNGEVFIPNAYLLEGKKYELLVEGNGSNNETILYNYSFTPSDLGDTKELNLTSEQLTKVSFETDNSIIFTEGNLAFTLMDEKERLYSFPIPLNLNSDWNSVAYISSPYVAKFSANLFDETTDTGYFLIENITIEGQEQLVTFSAPLVEITAPEKDYINYIAVGDEWESDIYASRYLITQGIDNYHNNDVLIRNYVQKEGFSYKTFRIVRDEINDNYQLPLGESFTGVGYISSYYLEPGDTNITIYTDYYDENWNWLDYLYLNSATPQFNKNEILFNVNDKEGNPIQMKAENTNLGVMYKEAETNQIADELQLQYQIYDINNNKVGSVINTDQVNYLRADLPETYGEYSLQLETHNIPEDILDFNYNFSLVNDQELLGEVEITPPTGYSISSRWDVRAEIWGVQEGIIRSYDHIWELTEGNKLSLKDITIDPSREYIIHLDAELRDENYNYITYYKQLVLTADDLKNLTTIELDDNVVKLKSTIDSSLPLNSDQRIAYGIKADTLDDEYVVDAWIGNREFNELWIAPGQISVAVMGTDSGDNGYYLMKKDVVIDESNNAISFTKDDLANTVPVQLNNGEQTLSFSQVTPIPINQHSGSGIGYGYGWDNRVLNTVYMTPGDYNILFETIEIATNETPWGYFWEAEEFKVSKDNSSILFTGDIDLLEYEAFEQSTNDNGETIFRGWPKLKSGDLELLDVWVYREDLYRYQEVDEEVSQEITHQQNAVTIVEKFGDVNPDYIYDGEFENREYIDPIITITDQNEKELYRAKNYSLYYFYVKSTLQPGTYNFNFSLPVGPSEEAKITKQFAVVDSNAPFVTLSTPQDGLLTNNKQIEVAGKTVENGQVTVAAYLGESETAALTKDITADSNGNFTTTLNLEEDGTYHIVAYQTNNENIKSMAVSITVDTTAPQAPEVIVAEGDNGLELTWNAASDVDHYEVYGAQSGSDLQLLASNLKNASYLYEGILPGVTYQFKVVAYDAAGNSVESSIVEFTTSNFIATSIDVAKDLSKANLLKLNTNLGITLVGAFEEGYTATAVVTYSSNEEENITKDVALTYNETDQNYQGSFIIEPGMVEVVKVEGYITRVDEDTQTPENTNKVSETINKEVGATLKGTLSYGGTALTEEASVRLASWHFVETINTDGSGVFEFAGVPEGYYRLNATYLDETFYNVERNIELRLGTEKQLDTTIDLPVYKDVKFNFADSNGETITEDLHVVFRNSEGNSHYLYVSGYIGEDGYFTTWSGETLLEQVPIGKYDLTVYGRGIYEGTTETVTLSMNQNYVDTPIAIEINKKTEEYTNLTISFIDSNENPISLESLDQLSYFGLYSYSVYDAFGYDLGYYYLDEVSLSEDGNLLIENVVLSNDYQLYLKVNEYMAVNEEDITISAESNTIQVTLDEGVKLTGTLVTSDSTIVANPRVYAYTYNSSAEGTVDENGVLTIAGLKSDEDITYEINAPGYLKQTGTILSTDIVNKTYDLGTITLQAEKYIDGKVVDKDSKPIKHAYVYAYDQATSAYKGWARTDGDGYFKIRGLEEGSYKLNASKYGYPTIIKENVSTSENPVTIVLEEQGEGSFTGEGNSFSASTNSVTPSKTIQYRLDYKNTGDAAESNVKLTFAIPDSVELIANTVLLNGVAVEPTLSDSTYTVEVGEVAAGSSGVLTFDVKVNEAAEEAIVATANINETETLTSTTNLIFVSLNAPVKTASKTIKVYGKAKPNTTVEVYAGDIRLAQVKTDSRWWFADVTLPVAAVDTEENFTLTAKVSDATNAHISDGVKVTYSPTIPQVTDVTVQAGWNGNVKLNPYTGVATFAIVEKTQINTSIKFDQEIDEASISFIGEEYKLSKSGDSYVGRIPGDWSSYGEQLLELTFKKGDIEITLPLMEVIVLIDPSGYVFEGSMDNPIEGVTAVVLQEQNGTWNQWDAEKYGQVNPQTTDSEGKYGWDVIAGNWKVNFSKEGYDSYTSRIVVVPPAETQLNVPLVRTTAPVVDAITPNTDATNVDVTSAITIVFDRPMDETNMTDLIKVYEVVNGEPKETAVEGTFELEGLKGYKVDESKGSPTLLDSEGTVGWFTEDTTKSLSKTVVFTPTVSLAANTTYQVVISGTLIDYDGKIIGDDVKSAFTTKVATSGGSVGGGGFIPLPANSEADLIVNKAELTSSLENGKVVLNLDGQSVLFENDAWTEVVENGYEVVIKTDASTITVPSNAVTLNKDASLLVTVKASEGSYPEGYTQASEQLTVTFATVIDGEEETINLENEATVSLTLSNEVDSKLAGIYQIVESKPQYLGRKASTKISSSTTLALLTFQRDFEDTANHWAKDDIAYLVSHHIVDGVSTTSFDPEKAITRAQFAKLIAGLLGLELTDSTASFTDVNENDWFAKYVAAVEKEGIFKGANGQFRPNDSISREEMATVIARVLSDKSSNAEAMVFADAEAIATWATTGVELAAKFGIIKGNNNQEFMPKANAKRAEAATMIRRLIDVLDVE